MWLTYVKVLVGVDNILETYDAGMLNFHFLWSLESRFLEFETICD
jgi:hypothetical protein